MTTIPERLVMNEDVEKPRSSVSFSLATDPTIKCTVGPALALHKPLQ